MEGINNVTPGIKVTSSSAATRGMIIFNVSGTQSLKGIPATLAATNSDGAMGDVIPPIVRFNTAITPIVI